MYLPRVSALRLTVGAVALMAAMAHAQRHSDRSSPATAPVAPAAAPIVAVSSGMGAVQFVQVNYGVPAPQALTRQLRFDDDRTRAAALSAIGAPGQYLQHGHIPMPRSIDLQLVALGTNDDLDALLTVELEQHLVTAVLVPDDGNWRRVATLTFTTSFYDAATTPSSWVRTTRSLLQPEHYRAIFHASSGSLKGNFTESEAHIRILNNKAIVTVSFESTLRDCPAAAPATQKGPPAAAAKATAACSVTERWLQADPADPTTHFELVTGSGHLTPREAAEISPEGRVELLSHLRSFTCQPFSFSAATEHFEPTANASACHTGK